MKKFLFFISFFLFFPAITFSLDPSSETYDLNGYTITPSGKTDSTNYSLLDVGVGESGITTMSGTIYSGDAGFARRIGNFSPDVNLNLPNGNECITGTYSIDFNVQDRDNSKLFAKIAYSTTALAFQNDINTYIILNNYAVISGLNCSNPNWSKSRNCTYNWDTSGISDGNYYVDINVWDVAKKAANQDSSDLPVIIDNTPPTINITTPANGSEVQDVLVEFSVNRGSGCVVSLSTITVDINGTESTDFNRETDCTFSQGSYSCSYYETSLYGGDWNLAVTASDAAGHEAQEISIFTFIPIVTVSQIKPSGVFVSGTQQIDFNVRNTARNTLYATLYYSATRGSKQNAITGTLNLNNHSSIQGLSCDDTDWSDLTHCSYQWVTTGVSDSNYFIDINLANAGGDVGSNSSLKPSVLDNTVPVAHVGDVSQTWVYEDRVHLSCSDTGSGCKQIKWYYFSETASCSDSKSDYTYQTYNNYLDIIVDHSDYLCLWVEDRADFNDTALSPQLHVDTGVYVVSSIPSESQLIVTQDLNNECRMYLDENLIIACDFESTIKISEWGKDLNRVWEEAPELITSPPKTIRVLIQSEIEAFYHKDYYIKFESDQRTVTSQGDEKNFPITVVRRRIIPLLTTAGELEVGTLTIKVRQR